MNKAAGQTYYNRDTRLEEDPCFSISVVIPAYFEEKTIASVVRMALPFADEVLVVNDGGTDDTSKNARSAGARVIELDRNMGITKALQYGLREAQGDIVVTLDADGQHDPSDIPGLTKPIIDGDVDLVMGKRPSFPYLSERMLSWMTSLRVPCSDACTGFRAVKREIAERMKLHGVCQCGTFVLEALGWVHECQVFRFQYMNVRTLGAYKQDTFASSLLSLGI